MEYKVFDKSIDSLASKAWEKVKQSKSRVSVYLSEDKALPHPWQNGSIQQFHLFVYIQREQNYYVEELSAPPCAF